jgi:hypothetical protein
MLSSSSKAPPDTKLLAQRVVHGPEEQQGERYRDAERLAAVAVQPQAVVAATWSTVTVVGM